MTEDEAKTNNRRGRPPAGGYESRYPTSDKLKSLSRINANTGCIIWEGALNDSGYGRLKVRSRFRRAHIVAWEIQNGPVPPGLVIDHIVCNNRRCINPFHMRTVTQSENCRRGNERRYSND